METRVEVHKGDCLHVLKTIENESIELIYLDPPFFTQKIQKLKTRDRMKEFRYKDLWSDHGEYADFIYERVSEMYRVLARNGNIFFHCDRNASHIIRAILDEIFGRENFRSEIIWFYKRWSNSKRGLLPAHQTIYFYSKSDTFTFNTIYQSYSSTTNIDQILQKRARDLDGKAVYARSEDGSVILGGSKKGVPLSDVWDIPYLNPKAKERVGYPTQKPLLLLERILSIGSQPGDWVLDPFCGSGTTLVASKFLQRNAIGIDTSDDAITLSHQRLEQPIRTESNVLINGRASYKEADPVALSIIEGLDYTPVQRNNGIDGILRKQFHGTPILIRVQRRHETLHDAASSLLKAVRKKAVQKAILVKTNDTTSLFESIDVLPEEVIVVESAAYSIETQIDFLLKEE